MIVNEVIKNLREMNNLTQYKLHEVAKDNDLSIEQLFLLIQLTERIAIFSKPPTIGELADSFSITPHTLSERIKRLEKKDLIEKIKDENDLRINRISATTNGHDLINRINKETGNVVLEKAIYKLEPEILNGLLVGLRELNKNFCPNN